MANVIAWLSLKDHDSEENPGDCKKANIAPVFKKEKSQIVRNLETDLPGKIINQILLKDIFRDMKDMMTWNSCHRLT